MKISIVHITVKEKNEKDVANKFATIVRLLNDVFNA